MAPKVHAPVSDYTGTVAGVAFADGSGETESVAALAYFRRKGYTIDEGAPREPLAPPATPPEPLVDPSSGTGAASSDGDSSGDGDGDSDSDVSGSADGKPERPHPVQNSAADWFEYLSAIKPDHGLEVGTKRADLIAAANAVDGTS